MRLILRVACSQSNPQRAEEARRLLRNTPVPSASLIQRIAFSDGNSQRAQAARELLKALQDGSPPPAFGLSLILRIAANGENTNPAGTDEVVSEDPEKQLRNQAFLQEPGS